MAQLLKNYNYNKANKRMPREWSSRCHSFSLLKKDRTDRRCKTALPSSSEEELPMIKGVNRESLKKYEWKEKERHHWKCREKEKKKSVRRKGTDPYTYLTTGLIVFFPPKALPV